MELQFREAQLTAARLQDLQELARQEVRSRELLARSGIALKPGAAEFVDGRLKIWECVDGAQVVGGCVANCGTGELISISVNPRYQNRGIGRTLVSIAVKWIRAADAARVWVAAPSDPTTRAHGFYRALGWQPTGERAANGDEILELPPC
jgi:ribosomal protein S18 acetylase RimI-like enzyme